MRSSFPVIRGWFVLLGFCLASAAPAEPPPVVATDTPRTRTLPGIASPAFPYAQPDEVGLSGEKLNRLGDEVAAWTANGDLVGAELLIIKDRKTVFHEAYGWSDREARVPMQRDSVFSIKSMSKPFTATAVLMLVEEGKLSLNDPVKKFVDSYPDERATIRDLLVQTTGYSGNLGKGGEHYEFDSREEWIENWAAEGPTEPFGQFSYSDFNWGALGHIVTEVSGMSLEKFTEQRIIEPLGLDDTLTGTASDRAGTSLAIMRGVADASTADRSDAKWRERLNPWYKWNGETGRYDLRWTNQMVGWGYYPGGWGLFSTAMDYAVFMQGWMNKGNWEGVRLLSEATVEEALREHAATPLRGYGLSYGYGWYVQEEPVKDGMPSVFWHGGGDGTIATAFPQLDTMVIFLTHSRDGLHLSALQDQIGMLEIFDHPGPYFVWADDSPPPAELSDQEQKIYVGSYQGGFEGNALVLRIYQEDGNLSYRLGRPGGLASWWSHLVPLGNHTFALGRYSAGELEAIDPRWRLRFKMERGEPVTVEIAANDEPVFTAHRKRTHL